MSDINAILDRHGIKRCGDSSCIFGPRGGMMTNGGCRCGHDQRRYINGPVCLVLRDAVDLARPVPARGFLGFWPLSDTAAADVAAQLGAVS